MDGIQDVINNGVKVNVKVDPNAALYIGLAVLGALLIHSVFLKLIK